MTEQDTATADEQELKEVIRDKYGSAAREAAAGRRATCAGEGTAVESAAADAGCGCGCAPSEEALAEAADPITSNLYGTTETEGLPEAALNASLGCGNPTALAELHAGEVVLDLGSGGGIDVLLSARRVGPTGKAYGLDMTGDMLELARRNQAEAGVENAEFVKGEIENIPLPDASVDVIISNCVINLSSDKPRVLGEAFRVLKPGGRLAISDIVVRGEVPAAIRRSVELWIGCVAGALEEGEYRRFLSEAGFDDVGIEPTRVYGIEDAEAFLGNLDGAIGQLARQADGKFMSAFVRARKPA